MEEPRTARPPSVRRRAVLDAVGSAVVVVGLVVVYVLLPLNRPFQALTIVEFVVGLALVAGLLAWQVRSIVRSATPALRAVEAIVVSLTVFLLVFASAVVLLATDDPHAFNEPISRLDALYFVVTVFATVGFGDIVPVSEGARLLVTVQMIGDLVLIGLGLRVILTAVDRGRRRANGRPPRDPT